PPTVADGENPWWSLGSPPSRWYASHDPIASTASSSTGVNDVGNEDSLESPFGHEPLDDGEEADADTLQQPSAHHPTTTYYRRSSLRQPNIPTRYQRRSLRYAPTAAANGLATFSAIAATTVTPVVDPFEGEAHSTVFFDWEAGKGHDLVFQHADDNEVDMVGGSGAISSSTRMIIDPAFGEFLDDSMMEVAIDDNHDEEDDFNRPARCAASPIHSDHGAAPRPTAEFTNTFSLDMEHVLRDGDDATPIHSKETIVPPRGALLFGCVPVATASNMLVVSEEEDVAEQHKWSSSGFIVIDPIEVATHHDNDVPPPPTAPVHSVAPPSVVAPTFIDAKAAKGLTLSGITRRALKHLHEMTSHLQATATPPAPTNPQQSPTHVVASVHASSSSSVVVAVPSDRYIPPPPNVWPQPSITTTSLTTNPLLVWERTSVKDRLYPAQCHNEERKADEVIDAFGVSMPSMQPHRSNVDAQQVVAPPSLSVASNADSGGAVNVAVSRGLVNPGLTTLFGTAQRAAQQHSQETTFNLQHKVPSPTRSNLYAASMQPNSGVIASPPTTAEPAANPMLTWQRTSVRDRMYPPAHPRSLVVPIKSHHHTTPTASMQQWHHHHHHHHRAAEVTSLEDHSFGGVVVPISQLSSAAAEGGWQSVLGDEDDAHEYVWDDVSPTVTTTTCGGLLASTPVQHRDFVMPPPPSRSIQAGEHHHSHTALHRLTHTVVHVSSGDWETMGTQEENVWEDVSGQ
ncbi:Hypothetical protein, putative, partial [Bodo saltans]